MALDIIGTIRFNFSGPLYTIISRLYSIGGILVKHFSILIRSFSDVQEFVSISSAQPFDVTVGGEGQDISGKSLMAMLGLNFRHPLLVSMNCDDEQFSAFRTAAARFLA